MGIENSTQDTASAVGLGEFYFLSLKKYKDRITQFVADTGERDTCGDLLSRCVTIALKLRNTNCIIPGDIVGLCTCNHINSVVPYISAQFLGAVSAHFDFNQSPVVTVRLLELVQPKVMFVDQQGLTAMEECINKAGLDTALIVFGQSNKYPEFSEYLKPRKGEQNFYPYEVSNVKDTAVILFSSGTTGLPKGICLSHHTLLRQANYSAFFNQGDLREQEVYLVYSSLYWISAIGSFTRSILLGNAKVVCSKFDPTETWHLVEKYKVSFMFLGPHDANEMLRHRPEKTDISSLKVFYTGSCPVTKKLMEELREALPNTKVIHGYGQTEAGGIVTLFNSDIPSEMVLQKKKPRSCGKIWEAFQWKVVDVLTEERLGPNKEGELRLKSDFIMNGYFKMDSSHTFDGEGYLRTGDLVYYDEDYCFYIVDRLKEMFKWRGWHIIPSVLEGELMLHPAVKEAAVVGIPHEVDGHIPTGAVVLHKGYSDVTPKDIEAFIEKRVYHMQTLRGGVKIIKELPRTSTGKVRKEAVKELILNCKLIAL